MSLENEAKTRHSGIIVLAGKSGSGKDTIRNALLEASREGSIDQRIEKIVSATTRKPRAGELDGREYHFLTNEEFEEKIKSGEIFEHREYDSKDGKVYYGSEKINLSDRNHEVNYITILDLEGAKAYQEAYGKENVFVVEVDAPEEIRMQRVIGRESDPEKAAEEWSKRSAKDIADFNDFSRNGVVNYTLDNSSVDFGGLDEDGVADKEAYLNDIFSEIFDSFDLYRSKAAEMLKDDEKAWITIHSGTDENDYITYDIDKSTEYDADGMALDYAHLYMSLVSPEEYAVYQGADLGDEVSDTEKKEIFDRMQEDIQEVADEFKNHLMAGDIEEEKTFLNEIKIDLDPEDRAYQEAQDILDNIYVYNNYLDNKDKRSLDIDEQDLYRQAFEVAERVIDWTTRAGKAFGSDLVQPLDTEMKKDDVYERIIDRKFKKETECLEQIVELLCELEEVDLTEEQKAIIEEGKALVKDLCKIDLELAVLEKKSQNKQGDEKDDKQKDDKQKKKDNYVRE